MHFRAFQEEVEKNGPKARKIGACRLNLLDALLSMNFNDLEDVRVIFATT